VAPDAGQIAELEARMMDTGARLLIWEVDPPAETREAIAALGLAQAVVPSLAMPPVTGDFLSGFREGVAELDAALASLD